jgi:hypothetical protein
MAKSKAGGHRPGGGIASKNLVVRTGQQKKRDIPAGVAQLGQKQGNKAMGQSQRLDYSGVEIIAGTGFKSELGNSVAAATKCGPGGSREVMKTGSQSTYGAPAQGNPMPKAKALFPGWEK